MSSRERSTVVSAKAKVAVNHLKISFRPGYVEVVGGRWLGAWGCSAEWLCSHLKVANIVASRLRQKSALGLKNVYIFKRQMLVGTHVVQFMS
ncbi:MAG: hypothetical protein ACLUKN_08440 [Bacilli bacterium]